MFPLDSNYKKTVISIYLRSSFIGCLRTPSVTAGDSNPHSVDKKHHSLNSVLFTARSQHLLFIIIFIFIFIFRHSPNFFPYGGSTFHGIVECALYSLEVDTLDHKFSCISGHLHKRCISIYFISTARFDLN